MQESGAREENLTRVNYRTELSIREKKNGLVGPIQRKKKGNWTVGDI